MIAMDLPGFGHSPMPSWPISISAYARLLDRLLDALGIDAAALVGNSMGGFISAELAIAYPQRVERLVLVSAAGISTYDNRGALHALPVLRRRGADPHRLHGVDGLQVRHRRAPCAPARGDPERRHPPPLPAARGAGGGAAAGLGQARLHAGAGGEPQL